MAANEWVKGETAKVLAVEWGISVITVEHVSAEASRILRRAVGDPKDVKQLLLAGLQQVTERTLAKEEFRTYIEAVRTIASFHGLVRDRLEISKGADDFENWTVAEYEAYIASGEYPARLLKRDPSKLPNKPDG
jgi:hypothetical protein